MKHLALMSAVVAGSLAVAAPAAAQTAYTSDAAFTAATAGQTFTTQSFESTPTGTSTSLDFGNVVFSCAGSTYCPGFFGRSNALQTDGSFSVYYATPDTATFTFDTAINSFGIDVINLGDVGATNFFLNVGTGNLALQQNYTGSTLGVTFAGVTSATAFTSVTFSASQINDGIYFDRLRFATAAVAGVPEPATWAMMMLGFGAIGFALRRRPKAAPRVRYA